MGDRSVPSCFPARVQELASNGFPHAPKAPFLPRLGLLAVATSDSVVTIYSLPHPEALNAGHQLSASGETDSVRSTYHNCFTSVL